MLLLLAAFALATVADGATPGTPVVVVEQAEASPADVPGSAEAVSAEAPVVLVALGATVAFADATRIPASWAVPSDVPPPEA